MLYFILPLSIGPRLLVYTLMPTVRGDTMVYGVQYTQDAVSSGLRDVYDNGELLPDAIVAGRHNRDIIDVAVSDSTGARIFSSNRETPSDLTSRTQTAGAVRVATGSSRHSTECRRFAHRRGTAGIAIAVCVGPAGDRRRPYRGRRDSAATRGGAGRHAGRLDIERLARVAHAPGTDTTLCRHGAAWTSLRAGATGMGARACRPRDDAPASSGRERPALFAGRQIERRRGETNEYFRRGRAHRRRVSAARDVEARHDRDADRRNLACAAPSTRVETPADQPARTMP